VECSDQGDPARAGKKQRSSSIQARQSLIHGSGRVKPEAYMLESAPAMRRSALAFVLALGVFSALLLADARVGLNLNDEGFLWYGTWRTSTGEVPLRDFQSYDPGRYYWGAAWYAMTGSQGVVALRAAAYGFASIAIFCILKLLAGILSSRSAVLFSVCLGLWLFAPYKAYEFAFSLLAVVVGARLASYASPANYALVGFYVGLAAWFGRNHALYAAVAFALVAVAGDDARHHATLLRRLAGVLVGVLVGALPMLLHSLLTPGFAERAVQLSTTYLSAGVANLPREVPWPWRLRPAFFVRMAPLKAASDLLLRLHFALMPPFAVGLVWWTATRRNLPNRALLLSAGCVGLCYLHYAFSRPDLGHVASSVPPLLVALAVLASAASRPESRATPTAWMAAMTLVAALTAGPSHPSFRRATEPQNAWVGRTISGDRLWVESWVDVFLQRVALHSAASDGQTPLLASPIFPGLYAALGLRSPLWKILFALPGSEEEQRRAVAELEQRGVALAVACDQPRDWPFSENYPILWRHLQDDWSLLEPLPGGCELRQRRNSGHTAPS